MGRFLSWIKTHKLVSILIIILAYLLLKNNRVIPTKTSVLYRQPSNMISDTGITRSAALMQESAPASQRSMILPEAPPSQTAGNRLVIENSYLSLLVKNVSETQTMIIRKAEELGGYMVNTSLSNPQEAASGQVVVRIPSRVLDEALAYFRSVSVKVISENLEGQDVTDEYVDLEARGAILTKTKAKFEAILEAATAVQDILTVQRELINLQTQIDNLKGQQNYLEKNAQMAKIAIYLATDELALPYAPQESWRPSVIFKQAVRSLVKTVRKAGTALIWLGVYSVIWIPVLILIYLYKRRKNRTGACESSKTNKTHQRLPL